MAGELQGVGGSSQPLQQGSTCVNLVAITITRQSTGFLEMCVVHSPLSEGLEKRVMAKLVILLVRD